MDALQKRHRNADQLNEFLFAQLTSWVANTGFRSTEKSTTAHDFMPSQWMKKAKQKAHDPKRPKRMTKKSRQKVMLGFTAAFAGARIKGT